MTPERYARITTVLKQRQPDLTVITDEVHKGRNISAIMRTCDAVGIDTLHVIRPKAGYRHYRGTALGSHKWVNIALHDHVNDAVSQVKALGCQIVVAHLSATTVDYRQVDYTRPTALLVGTENNGPSDTALSLADAQVSIPMVGMVGSYNVSVASAIILAEAYRQREEAGYYQRRRLPEAVYRERLFCWCQPIVADYCQRMGLPYPDLDSEGEIIDGTKWYQQARNVRKTDKELQQHEDISIESQLEP